METMKQKPPRRYLVDDEVIEIRDKRGEDNPFRMRIWRGRDVTPLVLISHVVEEGCMWPGPSRFTCKIANHVQASVLRAAAGGMLYFEDELDPRSGERVLTQCYFEFYGDVHQPKLFKPDRKVQPWDFLEHVLGGQIER